ncbi:MAG: hypothetical protein WBO32_13550 [Cyclobacteriaceae bacterium]
MFDKKYPDTLMGFYEIDLKDQTLYGVDLPLLKPCDYKLRKIILLGGIALAKFENGFCVPLLLSYNPYANQYSFLFNNLHFFEIKSSLRGVIEFVQIHDFSQAT